VSCALAVFTRDAKQSSSKKIRIAGRNIISLPSHRVASDLNTPDARSGFEA